jgi:hypothetical protein
LGSSWPRVSPATAPSGLSRSTATKTFRSSTARPLVRRTSDTRSSAWTGRAGLMAR